MSYLLTPQADTELTDAVAFCEQPFSPAVAENCLATFELKARRLFPIGRYPYSILYRVDAGVVCISAIAHHSRRPGYWDKGT